ncbi:hypothetical protein Glove_174g10 [Diversispora epigaea]|uniref:Protein kinase domain-containing protein n=1 Tax=Diversispora epigaea TaxID=1348612 RepID=A0A397IX79_9GLOM|nr:hypothetical protein Glove_174g10 [Diversispora epigaea]
MLRGKTYQKLEKYNEELTNFNKLLGLEPNNVLALKSQGETYQKLEKYDEDFNKLLEIRPSNAFALRLRGETYRKLEKYNEALIDFNNLLEIESNNDLYEEIIDKCNEMLEVEPNNALALRSRGNKTEKNKNKTITDTNTQKQRTESRMVQGITTESIEFINWIPYQQFEDIKHLAEGGFGVVYSAIWIKDRDNKIKVAFKNLHNSKDTTDNFLKEVISHGITSSNDFIIQCYGITKDPNTNNNIMVIEFAEDGSLHRDLMLNFDKIIWQTKLERLYCIATGSSFWNHFNGILGLIRIADLGLCRNIDSSTNSNYVYGIIPYVAPEIFKDSSYSQASDIYSFGILMWEFTSGHKPFSKIPHDHNLKYEIISGLRPEITDVTLEIFSNLIERCWDSNPKLKIYKWCWGKENEDQFIQAEQLRRISVELKFLGGREENNYGNYHPEAIYRSRRLNSIIELVSEVKGYKSVQENFEISK